MFCPQKHRAFTLIEMLAVIVIMGIAAGIVIPQIGSRDDLRTASAAREVMADLIYAQNRAISTQLKHYVHFDGNTYTLYTRTDDSLELSAITHPLTKAPYVQTFAIKGSPLQ